MTLIELAEKRGLSRECVKKHLARARKRLDNPDSVADIPNGHEAGHPTMRVENTKPEQFADAVIALSEPGKTVAAAGRESGLSSTAVNRIVTRMEGDLAAVARPIQALKLKEITDEFGQLSIDAIRAITPEKLEEAKARDLAVVAGVAIDKWQLLRGQPTTRMEITDRRKMDEVAAILLKEAARRGITVTTDPVTGEVSSDKSPYRNIHDQRLVKEISSGDPVVEV